LIRPRRNLPPLQVGTAYAAVDFEYFEYSGSTLTGSKAILRLHLKNETTIDLPVSDAELQRLLSLLIDAFPQKALEIVRSRAWGKKE
jgi:hypothetical protein